MYLGTALLLFGSSYNKISVFKWFFYAILIAYMTSTLNFEYGWQFPLVNYSLILLLPVVLHFTGKANTFTSIFAPIIWSISIDTITFILFPEWNFAQLNYFGYVAAGLAFNIKSLWLPILVSVVFHLIYINIENKLKTSKTSL